jgi:hypothetical protein
VRRTAGARVGVRQQVPDIRRMGRLFANAQLASFNFELRNYIHEMGMNDDSTLYQKVPIEQVHHRP